MSSSKYESMRTDPSNWKLGVIYSCSDDPRVIVKQRFPIGWTWNFANRWVFVAIVLAVLIFVAPAAIAWDLGVRSPTILGLIFVASLCLLMLGAHRLARDPDRSTR